MAKVFEVKLIEGATYDDGGPGRKPWKRGQGRLLGETEAEKYRNNSRFSVVERREAGPEDPAVVARKKEKDLRLRSRDQRRAERPPNPRQAAGSPEERAELERERAEERQAELKRQAEDERKALEEAQRAMEAEEAEAEMRRRAEEMADDAEEGELDGEEEEAEVDPEDDDVEDDVLGDEQIDPKTYTERQVQLAKTPLPKQISRDNLNRFAAALGVPEPGAFKNAKLLTASVLSLQSEIVASLAATTTGEE